MKSFTKIALLSSTLLLTTGLTTLIAVSCSNTSDPAIVAATSFNILDGVKEANGTLTGTTRKITIGQTSVSVEPAVKFDDKDGKPVEYKSAPQISGSYKDVAIQDQKAVAYFRNLTNFTIWLQGFTIQTQNFLSSTPANLVQISNDFSPFIDLACGLAATLNDGVNTARLGLKEISFNWDLKNSIDRHFKPYGTLISVTADIGKVLTWKEEISISNLKYNWWTTNSSNAVNWMPDNWDVQNQNQALWVNLPSKPKPTYSLTLAPISFDVEEKAIEVEMDGTKRWVLDGITTIVQPEAAFQFQSVDTKKASQDIYVFLVEADKNRRGDVLNGSFLNFVKNKEQEINLLNFIKVLSFGLINP